MNGRVADAAPPPGVSQGGGGGGPGEPAGRPVRGPLVGAAPSARVASLSRQVQGLLGLQTGPGPKGRPKTSRFVREVVAHLILLRGPPGCGKTTVISYIASLVPSAQVRDLRDHRSPSRCCSAMDPAGVQARMGRSGAPLLVLLDSSYKDDSELCAALADLPEGAVLLASASNSAKMPKARRRACAIYCLPHPLPSEIALHASLTIGVPYADALRHVTECPSSLSEAMTALRHGLTAGSQHKLLDMTLQQRVAESCRLWRRGDSFAEVVEPVQNEPTLAALAAVEHAAQHPGARGAAGHLELLRSFGRASALPGTQPLVMSALFVECLRHTAADAPRLPDFPRCYSVASSRAVRCRRLAGEARARKEDAAPEAT